MEMQYWPQRLSRANSSAVSANRFSPKIDEACALAGAIVESVRAPRVILDEDLHVVTVNRAFCHMFNVGRREVQGRPFHALDGGRWNIPELSVLLTNVQARDVCKVDADVSGIGRRTLLLNARELYHESNDRALVLLSIADISERRAGERRTAELLQQKETLLQETQQRIANNLQIIAGILLVKARAVQSEAARLSLKDTHHRLGIMEHGEQIEITPYLSRFCETRAIAPVGDSHPITIEGQAHSSKIASRKSVSIRRLATELVVNALKRAFGSDRAAARTVAAQEMEEPRWRLIVSDTGAGMSKGVPGKASPGRGTGRERNGSC